MKTFILIITFFGIMSSLYAQEERKLIRQGNKDYKADKFTEAEESYRKALEKKPQSLEANYNVGNVLYKQNKYLDAASKYSSLTSEAKDRKDLANIYYNLGNSYMKANKLDESIKAYKQSLKLNPTDKETKFNLAYAQRQLIQQQQQQQQQKNNQNDNKDKEKDKQNKEDQNKDQQDKNKQQQKQNQEQQKDFSQEDANRMLEALQNDEKELQKRLKQEKVQRERGKTLKNW